MKLHLTAIFLAAALLIGLSGSNGFAEPSQNKIHGVWAVDIEKTIAASEEMKKDLADDPAAMEMLKAMLGNSFINIDTNRGVISGNLFEEEMPETKFTIVSDKNNIVKIKDEDGEETEITILNPNSISFSELVLVRKQ